MGLQFKCSLQLAIHWGIFSDATAAAAAESVQAAMRERRVMILFLPTVTPAFPLNVQLSLSFVQRAFRLKM